MTDAWGHAAGKLPSELRGCFTVPPEPPGPFTAESDWWEIAAQWVRYQCWTHRCEAQVTHWTASQRKVGREARTERTTRLVCHGCAQRFAGLYGVVVSSDPPPPVSTLTLVGHVPDAGGDGASEGL